MKHKIDKMTFRGENTNVVYNDYYIRPAFQPTLIDDITKAINGQYSAVVCYEQLAKLAPNEEIRKKNT